MRKLIDAVGPLRCELELPSSWSDFFDRRGAMPARLEENRRFPRSYLRGVAALEYRQSLPALPRAEARHAVYTKDVSRAGIGFLHSEPLYPMEQMKLALPDGKSLIVEVVRCRRIQPRCFEIGAVFATEFRDVDLDEPEQ
jgi:hypothetical protein